MHTPGLPATQSAFHRLHFTSTSPFPPKHIDLVTCWNKAVTTGYFPVTPAPQDSTVLTRTRRRDENKQNPHDGCARGTVWTLRMTHNDLSAVQDLSVGVISLIFTAMLDHREVWGVKIGEQDLFYVQYLEEMTKETGQSSDLPLTANQGQGGSWPLPSGHDERQENGLDRGHTH